MKTLTPKQSDLVVHRGNIEIELRYIEYSIHVEIDITDAYNALDIEITEDEDYLKRQLEHIGDPVDIVDKCLNGGAELKVWKIWV